MEKKYRLLRKLIAAAEALEMPANYYHGRRRWPSELPDNVLCFMRSAAGNLSPHTYADFHHRWVLLIALAGRGIVRIDRQQCELTPGQALLIPPLHLHDYPKLDEPAIRWLFVTFEWPGHTAHSTAWRGVRVLNATTIEALDVLLITWRKRPPGDGTLLAAQVMNLLMILHSAADKRVASRPDAAEANPAKLLEAVQMQLRQTQGGPMAVRALARRMGSSESHLRARFRRETGISLGRYLREVRLRAAAILLREEGLNVKTAAERMGFNNIYSFSRAFKHVIGVPPSQIKHTRKSTV